MSDEEIALNHRRIVEVLLRTLRLRQMRQVAIIVVEVEVKTHQSARQLGSQGGFARAGTAGNGEHYGRNGKRGDFAAGCFAHGFISPCSGPAATIFGISRSSNRASCFSTCLPA